jgi:hypothetical protein
MTAADESKGADVGHTREPDYDAEMRLADGLRCDDCRHFSRCAGFGFTTPGRTSCDFWPTRFLAKATTPGGAS